MKGITLGSKEKPLEIIFQEQGSLSLLSRKGPLEFLKQEVAEGMGFFIYPAEDDETFEFFYLLEGEIQYEEDHDVRVLREHDYFSVYKFEGTVIFKVLKRATFLWCTNNPIFYQISKDIQELLGIAKEIENKDKYTFNHSRRVQDMSMKIARKLDLRKGQLHNIFLASGLHDIGKVNIPSEILTKPGKLTKEEFDIIKKHPQDGADMVEPTYYEDIYDIILQHHERLDGSGYPIGLKGNAIEIEAQIIGVADTFDAMTNDRAYRKAFTAQYAYEEIMSLTDIHFDSIVTKAFEQVLLEEELVIPVKPPKKDEETT
ncbi:phosphohydrolase [Bacillus coahuilensis m2-6]|uniref:HD-GYP domain-containing protein n=1 Tax=Bacillus coahuilensis TaxID=408580 RepID=UPI000185146F|nr:HD-GYP domain-containing protein [Bacillus coahuilensis]KUP05009.1 phosphohydrolase [Bacillus coahuilensis m2-6]